MRMIFRWLLAHRLLLLSCTCGVLAITACFGDNAPPPIKRRLEHRPQLIQPLSLAEIYQATPMVPFGVVTDGVAAEGAELSETEAIDLGAQLYAMNCAPCHRANGEGNLNRFPALNHNAFVTAQSPQPLIRTVLHGRGVMPAFHPTLNPTEIAAVLSYIRQAWSNDAAPVTAAQVREVATAAE